MPAERYHPLFAEDLASACKYYDDISPDFGQRFRKRVVDSIASILERPGSYGQIGGVYRGALLNGFPYVVVYSTAEPSLTSTAYGTPRLIAETGSLDYCCPAKTDNNMMDTSPQTRFLGNRPNHFGRGHRQR